MEINCVVGFVNSVGNFSVKIDSVPERTFCEADNFVVSNQEGKGELASDRRRQRVKGPYAKPSNKKKAA